MENVRIQTTASTLRESEPEQRVVFIETEPVKPEELEPYQSIILDNKAWHIKNRFPLAIGERNYYKVTIYNHNRVENLSLEETATFFIHEDETLNRIKH